jgi:putative DNA primase/helicase
MKQKPLTKSQIQKLYAATLANVKRFPGLAGALAEQLHVSQEAILATEIGYYPAKHVWVLPERDEYGEVIGLTTRTMDGKKFMVPGSKRGLFYSVAPEVGDIYDRKRWTRTNEAHPCPLCGKPDGCLYPEGEYENPAAIICRVISEGAVRPMKLGHLHILDAERNADRTTNMSSLAVSNRPTLIVEGGSDVCAAYDLGFVAVGRPNDKAKLDLLAAVVAGKKVCIIGENDAGAGVAGMEATFAKLYTACPECTKLMPPAGIKDLRKWLHAGLTPDELLSQIEHGGSSTLDPSVFPTDIAFDIANQWLREKYYDGGTLLLRTFRNGYIMFNGHCYQPIDDELIHGRLYEFLHKKQYADGAGTIKRYKPTRTKVRDILDACSAYCPIDADPPVWLTKEDRPDPTRLIAFQNGILNVDEYAAGHLSLANPDPALFSFNVLPYAFDENAESPMWEDFLDDIFNGDQDKVQLMAQWLGYNCVPDMSYEKLMIWQGRPRSGKGTCLEAIQAMLGKQNCTVASFTQLATQFPYETLVGRLSAAIAEAKAVRQRDSDMVLEKLLTIVGADQVGVNRKNITALPIVRLFCRFTLAMNDLPPFTDHSGAFEARTCLLTFDNSYIGREDRKLKHRIYKEAAEGRLINFALRGLQDLYQHTDFVLPRSSAMVMRTFRELVSPISTFADRCLKANHESAVPLAYLYAMWRWWCDREGLHVTAKSTFVRNLLATMPDAVHVREGEIENQEQVMAGVEVLDWASKEMMKGA